MLVRVSVQSPAAPGGVFTWAACPPRPGVQVQRGPRAVPRPCRDGGVDHLLEKLSCYPVTDRSHTQRKRKATGDVNDMLHKLGLSLIPQISHHTRLLNALRKNIKS